MRTGHALALSLASLALSNCARADYVGLAVESYVGAGWVANGFANLTAWRVYAEFNDPNDALISVFGSPLNPLSLISSDGTFYNDLVFDSTGPPENHTTPPYGYWANQWDTYVTIGVDDAANGFVWVDPEFCERLRFSCTGNNNAAYFVTPPAPPHSHPVNGRVLVAQLTVAEGESVNGVLNLQFDGGAQALDQPFQSPDPCPEDLNNDGVVNVLDLLQLLAAWGPCPACIEDLNGDGVVDVEDLLLVLAAWGPCPGTFVYVGTHPFAPQQAHERGRWLRGLYPFLGKLYVGYGRSGHEIAPYDPATGGFVHEWTAKTAEGCMNYRALLGRLFVPSNQVLGGVDYSVGTPWEDGDVPAGLHLYDINVDDSGHLWLVGSSGAYATAWRSVDGGATWEIFHQEGPTNGDFSRFHFVGVYDGRVYLQTIDGFEMGPVARSIVFDGTNWSDGPDLLPIAGTPGENYSRGLGWRPVVFADQMVYAQWGAHGEGGFLYAFDGGEARLVYPGERVYAFTVDGDRLWVLDRNYEVRYTSDLQTYTSLANACDGSRSIGVLDGAVYVGTKSSELYMLQVTP